MASPPHHLVRASVLIQCLLSNLLLLGRLTAARYVPVEYLYPPFNLTYFHFIDTNGVFLLSPNTTFAAAFYNPGAAEPSRFFLSVLHAPSHTPVWTATTGSTILESIVLSLTASGLTLSNPTSPSPAWSTPSLAAPVAALRLLDTGELALIDGRNASLWSSFSRPTDTLLPGQSLRVRGGDGEGATLTSPASDQDPSPGAYRLVLTAGDALLQWSTSNASFVSYWALSSDVASVRNSNGAVESMVVNASGLYLLTGNGRDTVFRVLFSPPPSKGELRLVKLDPSGRLRVMSYAGNAAKGSLATVWAAPSGDCDLPLPCRSLGLCTPATNGSSCVCPLAFTYSSGGCSPADGSALPIPENCVGEPPSSVSYKSLGDGIGYFANKFAAPVTSGEVISACQDLCSANCSCLGFFYKNSSKSCFLMQNQIGSVFNTGIDVAATAVGFIKTLPPPSRGQGKGGGSSLSSITILFGIVLPTVAAVLITVLLYVMGAQWARRRQLKNSGKKGAKDGGEPRHLGWFKLPMASSSSIPSVSEDADSDRDEVLIPGLPARFTYADLETATNGFKSQIGSGGFGSVYKGKLPDQTTVAVKRMNNLGLQGRREFLTEIAVIGNVHHVNLVKLRGFCAEGARQLLVYEYMNRGSLDQCLFRASARDLEWPDRLRVCIGAARGLAYLHAGCDRKILHCDVKPENILLDDRGCVKIADFGLAKLMNPEQSGLFTTMRGTRGYLAPEWLMNAPITDKADVYSFGMVLLEIVRGKKNAKKDHSWSGSTSASSEGGSAAGATERSGYFPALALDMHDEGRYEELVDPRLEGRADVPEVARVVRVALCCLHEEAALRPSMTAVAGILDGSMDVSAPRVELLQYLKMYGRGLVESRTGEWADGGKRKGKGSDMTGAASSSWSPPSCVSAQQLSGPR